MLGDRLLMLVLCLFGCVVCFRFMCLGNIILIVLMCC